jgi:hypothetical protein
MVACGGIVPHLRGRKFQGDLAVKRFVVGQKHLSHACALYSATNASEL